MTILEYPDKLLSSVCDEIPDIDDSLREIAKNLGETLNMNGGYGLSANQIGWKVRLISVVVENDNHKRVVFPIVNPKIEILDKTLYESLETCLSFPDNIVFKVKRPRKIRVFGKDINNRDIDFEAEDFLAATIQHEVDHINGKTFLDRLSNLKKNIYKKKFLKKSQHVEYC